MTFALLFTAGLLALLLSLVSFVQLLYLESLRLRTRDLPALEFFKQTLEEKLGMKTETGLLSFSLIKYSLVLLIAIVILVGLSAGRPITWISFAETAIAAWGSMLLTTWLVPYALYRRTSGRWLLPLVPLFKALALAVRPLVFALTVLESLIG